MKQVLAFAALSLALAAPVLAQTAQTAPAAPPPTPASRCAAFPASPTLPDGASANERQMRAGDEAYQAYGRSVQTILECRRVEAEEMMAIVRAHAARVQEYNAQVSLLNQTGEAWAGEVAEFNQRTGRRQRN